MLKPKFWKCRYGLIDHLGKMKGAMLDVYVLLQLEAVYSKNGNIKMEIGDICNRLDKSKPTILDAIQRLKKIDFIEYLPSKNQYGLNIFKIRKFQLDGKETLPAKLANSSIDLQRQIKNGSKKSLSPKEMTVKKVGQQESDGKGAGKETLLPPLPAKTRIKSLKPIPDKDFKGKVGKKDNKERKKQRKKESIRSKEKKRKIAPAQKIFFNFATKKWDGITAEDEKGWVETYPACNIEIELRRMREWLLANPEKKKKNYRRFIVNWLARSQDNGGTKNLRREEKIQWEK